MGGGASLFVRVTPKASRNAVTGLYQAADGTVSLCVKVTAAPDKGKANKAVIEVLAEHFAVPKATFVLVRGDTDRQKRFVITAHIEKISMGLQTIQELGKDEHGNPH